VTNLPKSPDASDAFLGLTTRASGVLQITETLSALRHGLFGSAEGVPMPLRESVANAEKVWSPQRPKGILSLTVTVLLCLPSLVAGAALLVNRLLYRDIEQWTQFSSALIALGIIFGNSAALLAAVVCAIAALRQGVSVKIKYAHLVVLTLATIADLSLFLRFGK
jgi:uncharacterized membrane protein YhaH (DUF805 family)